MTTSSFKGSPATTTAAVMAPGDPETDAVRLRDRVIAAATELGFHRVGIVRLDRAQRYSAFTRWLDEGMHGDMTFLERPEHRQGRADYRSILDGAVSAVVVAACYDSRAAEGDERRAQVARYAWGDDYHRLLKAALRQLAEVIRANGPETAISRACVDTAPILERDLAEQAGIGFVGKNTMLISPGLGSYTVLGELFTTAAIAETRSALTTDRCGSCRACLDACPSSAFPEPYVLDARRCLSYLTIEHRGQIDPKLRSALDDRIFGCDVCQEVCPYNQRAPERHAPLPGLEGAGSPRRSPSLVATLELRTGDYRRLTRGSSMARASRSMLRRNAAIALGNARDESAATSLQSAARDGDALVADAAQWALAQLAAPVTSGRD